MAIMQEPKDRLVWAREQAGYAKATDAISAFGWHNSTYHAHENGQNGIKPKVAERYAAAFGVTPEWLLYGRGEPKGGKAVADGWHARVRQAALFAGLSERDLVLKAGSLSPQNLESIASQTGVSTEWLATGVGEMAQVLTFAHTPAIRLRQARMRANLTHQGLSELSGVDIDVISTLENGDNSNTECMHLLAAALNVSADWLNNGASGSREKRSGADFVNNETIANKISHNVSLREDGAPQSAEVLELDPRRPKEGKRWGETQVKWNIPGDFLRELNIAPQHVLILEVIGDGMAPTLAAGERIIVDSSQKDPSISSIYAIDRGKGVMFQRLQVVEESEPPTVEVMFDNPRYRNYTVELGKILILGMAVRRIGPI